MVLFTPQHIGLKMRHSKLSGNECVSWLETSISWPYYATHWCTSFDFLSKYCRTPLWLLLSFGSHSSVVSEFPVVKSSKLKAFNPLPQLRTSTLRNNSFVQLHKSTQKYQQSSWGRGPAPYPHMIASGILTQKNPNNAPPPRVLFARILWLLPPRQCTDEQLTNNLWQSFCALNPPYQPLVAGFSNSPLLPTLFVAYDFPLHL